MWLTGDSLESERDSTSICLLTSIANTLHMWRINIFFLKKQIWTLAPRRDG